MLFVPRFCSALQCFLYVARHWVSTTPISGLAAFAREFSAKERLLPHIYGTNQHNMPTSGLPGGFAREFTVKGASFHHVCNRVRSRDRLRDRSCGRSRRRYRVCIRKQQGPGRRHRPLGISINKKHSLI